MKRNSYLMPILIILLASSSSLFFIEAAKSSHRCGLPPFLDDLPIDVKMDILAVWRDYKSGQDCTDRREKTQEIIDNLPSDLRAVIFGSPPSFLKSASVSVKKIFRDIMHNRSLSHDEKKQKLSELAEKILSKQQFAGFQRYLTEHERGKKEFEERLNELSPAAKEIYEKLERLKAERAEIMEKMSVDVRRELRQLFHNSRGGKRERKKI